MGTTRRGRSSAMALTACRGLMCLNSGMSGPMPAIGSSARSSRSGHTSAMPEKNPVSPAKYTLRDPEMT